VYSQEASLAVVKVADELTVLVLDSRNAVKSDDVSRDFIAHTDTKDGSAVIAAGSSDQGRASSRALLRRCPCS
jgi:hypothetical protein